MAFEVGEKVGDYEVVGVLGTGGMGKVYKVRNTISERVEAMKVLLPNLANNPDLEGRFLREIKLLATLDHPNIASLRTALRIENQLLMIMEFVAGTTLAQQLQQRPLPLAQTVDCVSQVLSALSYAHERGVIHRDIKPANMMLTPAGVVKLMDFGIAKASADPKLTVTGQTLGSLSYMSPEQVKAQPLDTRSDIYSLGVSLYELVTGKRPFKEDSDYALMAAHLQKTPVAPIELDPKLPPTLNAIILMAMAKDPASRFQSAAAFRNALESVRSELGPATPALGAASRAATAPPGTTTALGGPSGPAPSAPSFASAGTPSTLATQPNPASPAGEGSTMPLGGSPPTAPRVAGPPAAARLPATAAASPASAGSGPGPTSQPAPARSYRGFYMTAGALVAIAVIAIGATQLPKWHRAKAGGTSQPAASATPASSAGSPARQSAEQPGATGGAQPAQDQSAQQPETARPAVTSGDNTGAGQQYAPPPSAAVKTARREARAVKSSASAESKAGTPSVPPSMAAQESKSETGAPAGAAANAAKLKELRQRLTLLAARARSVKTSFDRLAAQQQAQGLGPRRDIAASVDRMSQLMDDAHEALVGGDAASAEQNMDSAEREVETLEKFFGG